MCPEYPHQASKLCDDQGISQMDQAPAQEGHSRLGGSPGYHSARIRLKRFVAPQETRIPEVKTNGEGCHDLVVVKFQVMV